MDLHFLTLRTYSISLKLFAIYSSNWPSRCTFLLLAEQIVLHQPQLNLFNGHLYTVYLSSPKVKTVLKSFLWRGFVLLCRSRCFKFSLRKAETNELCARTGFEYNQHSNSYSNSRQNFSTNEINDFWPLLNLNSLQNM